MKQLRLFTFILLIFATSGVSALQALSLLPNPAPSDPTANSSNPAAPNSPPSPEPPTVVRVPGWTYRGCWTDHPFDRTLISRRWKGYVTPEKCAQLCKGHQFFGLEYSNECYCGNTLSYHTQKVEENVCTNVCMGNFKWICGGRNALSLYEVEYEVEKPEIIAVS